MMTEHKIEQLANERLEKIKNARPNLNITGITYYVSNEGDDKADGLSPETAWKTIERVNQNNDKYKEGDAVLFRCGDTFRGNVKVRGITYSNYGEGEKPHMYASPFNAAKIEWTDEGNDVYSFPFGPSEEVDTSTLEGGKLLLTYDIGNLVFNHGEAHGIKKWKDVGYDLNFDLDFYHNLDECKLYLKSTKGNPAKRWESIEVCINRPVFSGTSPTCNNSTIDGFVVRYSGACSISFSGGDVRNNTVKNCEVEWIGGSVMHPRIIVLYGNGYQIWGGCDNILIENCYFNQCYDAAVTPQWSGFTENCQVKNFFVRGCLFEKNIYDFEYFLSKYKEGLPKADENHDPDSETYFENIYFEDNICRKTGYGFGSQRVWKSDARCVRCGHHANLAKNFYIRNNIFDRSDYLLVEVHSDIPEQAAHLEDNVYCQHVGKRFIDKNKKFTLFTPEEIANLDEEFYGKGATIIYAQRPLDY